MQVKSIMKLITKKSKAILSTCIAISMAGGAVLAAAVNSTIGPNTNVNIATSPVNGKLDGTTGASVMITNGPNARAAFYDISKCKNADGTYDQEKLDAEAKKSENAGKQPYDFGNIKPTDDKARVVIVGDRSDFGYGAFAGGSGTAIGAHTTANASHSNALGYGATVEKDADNSTAIGTNAKVTSTAANAVAIGANSIATKANEVSFGDSTSNIYRTLTNVADGSIAADSHEVTTGSQMYTEQTARTAADTFLNAKINTASAALGQEIDNVGALSAALAGLHPLNYDGTGSKFQLAASAGNYDGKKAAALGGFYNANKDVLLSFATSRSFNNHKVAANIGATFRIGAGSTQSSPTAANDALLQKVNALANDVSSLKQENEELKAQLAALQK